MTDIPAIEQQLLGEMRQHDYPRYLTALLLPASLRSRWLALASLHRELCHIRTATQEPMLATIRLKWWEERIQSWLDGQPLPQHPVLTALQHSITPTDRILRLIAAHSTEVTGELPTHIDELTAYVEQTLLPVIFLTGETNIQVKDEEPLRYAALVIGLSDIYYHAHAYFSETEWESLKDSLWLTIQTHSDRLKQHKKLLSAPLRPLIFEAYCARKNTLKLQNKVKTPSQHYHKRPTLETSFYYLLQYVRVI